MIPTYDDHFRLKTKKTSERTFAGGRGLILSRNEMYARVVATTIRSACISRGMVRERLIVPALVPQPSLPPLLALPFVSAEGTCVHQDASTPRDANQPLERDPQRCSLCEILPYSARNTFPELISIHIGNESRVSLPRFDFFDDHVCRVCETFASGGGDSPSFLFLLFGFFSRGFTYLSLSTCLSVPPLFRRPSHTFPFDPSASRSSIAI